MVGGADVEVGTIHKWAGRKWGGSYQLRRVFIDDGILYTRKTDDDRTDLGMKLDLNTVTSIRLGSAKKDDTDGFTIQIDHPRRWTGSEWFWFPNEENRNTAAETIADYTPQTHMMVLKRGLSHSDAQFKNIDGSDLRDDEERTRTLPKDTMVVALDKFHINLNGREYTRVLVGGGVKGYVDTNLLRRPTVEELRQVRARPSQATTQKATTAQVKAREVSQGDTPAPPEKEKLPPYKDRFPPGDAEVPVTRMMSYIPGLSDSEKNDAVHDSKNVWQINKLPTGSVNYVHLLGSMDVKDHATTKDGDLIVSAKGSIHIANSEGDDWINISEETEQELWLPKNKLTLVSE